MGLLEVGQSMGNAQTNLVEIGDVNYSIGGKKILHRLNMQFAKGKLTAILGPSGSGKSSLLKLLGAQYDKFDAEVEGRICINGVDILSMPQNKLREQRMQLGVLFQRDALFSDLTVFENVAFPLREHADLPESMLRDIVLLKLNAVGLRAASNLYPCQLSAGMARRVALARAIAHDPQIVLYDEPFNAQDPISTAILRKLVAQLSGDLQVTGILISHDIEMSLAMADYVYLLNEGRIVEQGCPHQIRCSNSAWVQQFLNGSLIGPAPFHYPGPSLRADLLQELAPSKTAIESNDMAGANFSRLQRDAVCQVAHRADKRESA